MPVAIKDNDKNFSRPLDLGHEVPMFPMPRGSKLSFFLLFLGSVIPGEDDKSIITHSESSVSAANDDDAMSRIRAHHRSLYALSTALGGKRYSYDTITNEVRGEAAWREHLGESVWEAFVLAKRRFDPHHVLCPGVSMWKC